MEVQPEDSERMMLAVVIQMLLHSALFPCSYPENMEEMESLRICSKNQVLVHGDPFSWYLPSLPLAPWSRSN